MPNNQKGVTIHDALQASRAHRVDLCLRLAENCSIASFRCKKTQSESLPSLHQRPPALTPFQIKPSTLGKNLHMTTAPAPQLQLRDARIQRPTVDRNGARAILDLEDWQLDALVDTGAIRGVLNIASRDTERRQLRFVVVCLEEYRQAARAGTRAPQHTNDSIAQLLFGAPQHEVRAQRVYRALNCKSTHLYALAAQNLMHLAPDAEPRSGPGGSGAVAWSQLLNFIAQRRLA
jgi:hypothetical protein